MAKIVDFPNGKKLAMSYAKRAPWEEVKDDLLEAVRDNDLCIGQRLNLLFFAVYRLEHLPPEEIEKVATAICEQPEQLEWVNSFGWQLAYDTTTTD